MCDKFAFMPGYSAVIMRWIFRKKAPQAAIGKLGVLQLLLNVSIAHFFRYSYLSDNIPNINFIPKEEV